MGLAILVVALVLAAAIVGLKVVRGRRKQRLIQSERFLTIPPGVRTGQPRDYADPE